MEKNISPDGINIFIYSSTSTDTSGAAAVHFAVWIWTSAPVVPLLYKQNAFGAAVEFDAVDSGEN